MAVFSRVSNVILVGLTLISLISAQPARAAMNAEDGTRLKAVFTEMIERYRADIKSQGGDLLTEGEVMVEPSDNYYAITLPHITTVSSDKSKTNLGMISINALPGDKKEEWKMTVALPTPITLLGPDGTQTGVLEIGNQNFAGVFHEAFGNFVRMNAQYKNITYTDTVENAKITIPELSTIYDLKEGSNKLWSGPMNGKASNVYGIFNKTGNAVKIREIAVNSNVKDYSVQEALAYQDKMQAMIESIGTDKPSANPQNAQGMYNTMFDFLTKVWDGFGSTIALNGLEVINPAKAGTPASTVKIERMAFGLEGNGFRSNNVTLRQTINLTDLSISPPPTGMKRSAPNNINVDLTVDNLPFKELAELGKKTLGYSLETPEGKNLAAANGLATMQQLLTNAGTTLTVRDTHAGKTSEYDVLLNGKANANIKAMMGATGKMRLEIFGIEKLIAYAQEASADPALPPEAKAKSQQFLQAFTVLQMIGQQGKNAKGQDIRSYDLELTADGKTMLNGADLMSVMGGMKPTP